MRIRALVTVLGLDQHEAGSLAVARILREAGPVISEKRGAYVWYAAVPAALAALRDALAPVR